MQKTFKEFFKKVTGYEPYPYQEELAQAEIIPDILNIPTGSGKTESAVLAIYLWRRVNPNPEIIKKTPRRLIYCLPTRVLVEQTASRIQKWITNGDLSDRVKIITIMGGSVDRDYKLHPEDDMIIIGTQDMLLSRALNRGYAMSPFAWPIEFGLLNNDCLWIMDEIQLMHNGFVTSVQLNAFRKKMDTYGPHKTVWMSATINPKWLKTIDSDPIEYKKFELTEKDKNNGSLSKRYNAKKQLKELQLLMNKGVYTNKDAQKIIEKHQQGTTTLIIINTVKRAQSLFKELKSISGQTETMLIHSRFRLKERKALNKKILKILENKDDQQDLIIVSTQVVEAGVDISSKTMITEMAPWSNMVQRFGRCNRKGEWDDSGGGEVYVMMLGEKQYAPYELEDMKKSKEKINVTLSKSISPKNIPKIDDDIIHEVVIREPDMLGLFDTVPDLAGNHTDVSRYVRSSENTTDVSILWREWNETYPPKDKISDEEICNVPIYDVKEFLKEKENTMWRYDILDGQWERTSQYEINPGQRYLVHSKKGGYTNELGWDGTSKEYVEPIKKEERSQSSENKTDVFEEGFDADSKSQNLDWITLNDHTVDVIVKTKEIVEKLEHMKKFKDVMNTVATYHDIGKAHDVFQETMRKNTKESVLSDVLWAKRKGKAYHTRKNFRHEAASALAFLKLGIKMNGVDLDLVTYLIASHHGKMRLSMRTFPKKKRHKYINSDGDYILGISFDRDENIPIFLSKDCETNRNQNKKETIQKSVPAEISINSSLARIGKSGEDRSWLQITLGLLKKYGPFKLAYLESIFRAADSKASKEEAITS